jgi:hypothetical protein
VSDPIDIKALDEYLKGGSDISQRYRELGREDVPPELDRRVLDEARAAAASGGTKRSRSWLRWSAPVALAASVVLVVTVVLERGVQDDTSFAVQTVKQDRQAEEFKLQEETSQARQQEPQAQFVPEQPDMVAPAAPPAAPLPKVEVQRSKSVAPEEVRVQAPAMRDQSLATSPVAVESVADEAGERLLANQQPAPSLGRTETISSRKEMDRAAGAVADTSTDASSAVQEVAVTGNRVRRAPGRTAGPRNTISNSAFSSETRPTADADAEQADPEKLLEEIRDLRRADKAVEADRAWQHFRKVFPDFPVADDDIARQRP